MKRIIKKSLCCFLAVLLVCSLAPSVLAVDAATSGTCGDGVTWTLTDGVLTISGNGRMTSSSGWRNQRTSVTSIVVEEGVTSLCTSAFENCSAAVSVSLPSTLTNIGASAFCNCKSLTEVIVPEGVLTIGGNAFTNCTGLISVTLPGTLNTLSDSAFSQCRSLVNLTLSEGITDLSQSTFMGCSALTSIVIPSTVETIGPSVFYNCIKLVSVYFSGDAPEITPASSQSTPASNPSFADRVTLYYKADASGWTSPTWNGYKTAVWNDSGNPFQDISESDYYYDAVLWAVNNNIITGTKLESYSGAGDGLYSPAATCTRGQIITLLWRALDRPEPTSTHNPFSDISPDQFYYTAILWAVEQNIITGIQQESSPGAGDGLFAPDAKCTRSQVITLLWRADGKPDANGTSAIAAGYADTAFYKDAVAWADTIGLLVNDSEFSATAACPRADIAMYLYLDRVAIK